MCVCVRERERDRVCEYVRVREYVFVCVCAHIYDLCELIISRLIFPIFPRVVAAATQKIYHIFSDLFRIAAAEHRLIFPLFFELRQPQSEQNMSSFLLMSQVPMEVSQLAFCADCDCCNSRKKI